MHNSVHIPTLWKKYNITYGHWDCIYSTMHLLHNKRGNNIYHNVIQRRASAGNQKIKAKI